MRRQKPLSIEQLHLGYSLGDVIVKPNSGLVIRNGQLYKLAPKAMQILLYLSANQCQLRTRKDIVTFGWGNSEVSNNNITHIISEIRHALDDHIECPRFIQTIPRKGYRMMIEAHPIEIDTINGIAMNTGIAQKNSSSTTAFNTELSGQGFTFTKTLTSSRFYKDKWLYVLFFTLMAFYFVIMNFQSNKAVPKVKFPLEKTKNRQAKTPNINTVSENAVAILMFSQTEQSQVPEYIAASIQQEIIKNLVNNSKFQVASLRATNDLGHNPTVDKIRERLAVKYILDGSISSGQQKIKISVNLIDSTTGYQVWASEVEGNLKQLLTVYEAISRKLINGLNLLVLGTSSHSQKSNPLPTTNFAAYDAYLQAKALYRQDNDYQSIKKTKLLLEQALSLDPKFNHARSALCYTYLELYLYSNDTEHYQEGLNICEISAQIKSNDIESTLALSKLYRVTGRYSQAKGLLDKALLTHKDNPEILVTLANIYADLKEYGQAKKYYLKAIIAEPAYWKNYYQYGLFLFEKGEYEQAISQFKKSITLNSTVAEAYNGLGSVYYLSYNFEQANIEWSKALAIRTSATVLTNIATSLFYLHQFEDATLVYQQALDINPTDSITWANLGDAYKYANQPINAQKSYKQALLLAQKQEQINPKNVEVQAQIGRIYSELEQCSYADSYKQTLLKGEPKDPYIFYDLALIAINCNHMMQAEGFIKKAISNGFEKKILSFDPQFSQFSDLFK